MWYSQFDIQPFGPSSGTCAPTHYHLAEQDRIIVIENILMPAGDLILTSAPKVRQRQRARREPQPDVLASLERSLVEHADIWAELAQY